jgi:hypothetical protein
MKACCGSGGIAPCILDPDIDGCEWSASLPDLLIPKEKTFGTHWRGGWMDPRAGLEAVVKRKIPSIKTFTVVTITVLFQRVRHYRF